MNRLEKDLNISQDIAVKSFIKKKKAVIPFPCGLGKTIIALKAVNKLKVSTVILVKPRLVEKWTKEINKWVDKDLQKLITLVPSSTLSSKSAFKYNIIKKSKPEYLITDEFQDYKEYKRARGKRWSKMSEWKCIKYHALISATPITNSEECLYTIFKACGIVGKGKLYDTPFKFRISFFNCRQIKTERFTILTAVSVKSSMKHELYSMLKSVAVETKVLNLLEQMPKIKTIELFSDEVTLNLKGLTLAERTNRLVEVSEDRLEHFEKYIDRIFNSDKRAVLYYMHSNLGNKLKDKYNIPLVSGINTIPTRNKTIAEFNEGKTSKIIGSIPANDAGHDFLNVDCIIILESSYSYATNLQAILRGRRFNPKSSIEDNKKDLVVFYMLYNNEETYLKTLKKKECHEMIQDYLYT